MIGPWKHWAFEDFDNHTISTTPNVHNLNHNDNYYKDYQGVPVCRYQVKNCQDNF